MDFWATDACKVWGKSQMRATYIPDGGAVIGLVQLLHIEPLISHLMKRKNHSKLHCFFHSTMLSQLFQNNSEKSVQIQFVPLICQFPFFVEYIVS